MPNNYAPQEHAWNLFEDALVDQEGRRFVAAFHLYLRETAERFNLAQRHAAYKAFASTYPRALALYKKHYP